MPLPVKREDCDVIGNEFIHRPTNKKYGAYPGSSTIQNENSVDIGDYRGDEIKRMAEVMLAERLKK